MAYLQLLEDDDYIDEILALPEDGMGYAVVEAEINNDGWHEYVAMNAELLVRLEDMDQFQQEAARYPTHEDLKTDIQYGAIDQYYDQITDFDVRKP